MLHPPAFERKLRRLDPGLFGAIFTQSLEGDRVSWLALQRAVRAARGSYVYLEIGSYLGGSLQPHLLDPKCRLIYSIDKRTPSAPDDRGEDFQYRGNTTEVMLQNLRGIDEPATAKVIPHDSDARDIDPSRIEHPPDLCFIDGEHTTATVLSDFAFCRSVCARGAIIYFHDEDVIHPAIAEIIRLLNEEGVAFRAEKLGGVTFAIALGEPTILDDGFVLGLERSTRRLAARGALKRRLSRAIPSSLLDAARRMARGFRN